MTPARAAIAASAVIVAFQLACKATRDALYLSTFDVTTLPRMVILSSILAGVVTLGVSRLIVRLGPRKLVPPLFGLSALLLLLEWKLTMVARPAAAILLYLHFGSLGALLVSGFWLMVNESFDPRSARTSIGRITAGASVGSLIGGLLPERIGATFSLTAMFPLLAILHLASGFLILALGREHPIDLPSDAAPARSSRRALFASPYLGNLALLVLLAAVAEGLIDYVFKARATAIVSSGEALLRFFAIFYTVTALLTILVQTALLRTALGRFGVGRSAAVLPAGLSLGALGGLLIPGLPSIVLARGTEMVLRNSFFRAANELLFGPVSQQEKRSSKLIIDVGAARLGDAVGGVIIQLVLVGAAAAWGQWLLAALILVGALLLAVARRLEKGYLLTLQGDLEARAGRREAQEENATAALLQTIGGFDLSSVRMAVADSPVVARTTPTPAKQVADPRLLALESGDVDAMRRALAEAPLTPELVDVAIQRLARDEVAPAAVRALRQVANRESEKLIGHLHDADEDFAIRRRIVFALSESPTPGVFEGLARALGDRRFEVRFRAARALRHLRELDPNLRLDPDRVLAIVLDEVKVERGVWESRHLIDQLEEPRPDTADSALLRSRADRSMEHVFTLLSLTLPADPLRLAYDSLQTDDSYLRGIALEYLETVLPRPVRDRIWPYLEPSGSKRGVTPSSAGEALERLLASRQSIAMAVRKEG